MKIQVLEKQYISVNPAFIQSEETSDTHLIKTSINMFSKVLATSVFRPYSFSSLSSAIFHTLHHTRNSLLRTFLGCFPMVSRGLRRRRNVLILYSGRCNVQLVMSCYVLLRLWFRTFLTARVLFFSHLGAMQTANVLFR